MVRIRFAACSDPLPPDAESRRADTAVWLAAQGETTGPTLCDASLWRDEAWWLVADPTGGTRASAGLPELVAQLPERPRVPALRRAWWTMSDNSQVLNALVDRGLCRLLHGHPLVLAGRDSEGQRRRFLRWARAVREGEPFPEELVPPLVPVRGDWSSPFTLVGGNLTALERLGETPWRPRPRGRTLLLESLSVPASVAPHHVAALLEDEWWSDVSGLVVGRFTVADRDDPEWFERCLSLLPPDLRVARMPLAGHGSDAWTVPLGEPICPALGSLAKPGGIL